MSQSPLDSPGDEDRRNRRGPGKGEGAEVGGVEGRAREGWERQEKKTEKNVEGRRSQGIQKCLSSQACVVFLRLSIGP